MTAEEQLQSKMSEFYADPLGCVNYSYPWGIKGTELEFEEGPDIWQKELLTTLGTAVATGESVQVAVASGNGVGKAQDVDMVIPIPDGVKRFGDLCVGDYVFDQNGLPVEVEAVFEQGVVDAYKVTFDDGSSTICNDEHLWKVKGRQDRRGGKGWQVRPLKAIISGGIKRSSGKKDVRQWEIPRQGVVEFVYKNVPIAPYVLGVWLGDGHCAAGRYSNIDIEVDKAIESCGYSLGYCRDGVTKTIFGIQPLLRMMGLLGCRTDEKHVPLQYKHNSPSVRAEIFRGLLDTDGTADKAGRTMFTSTSKALVDDVLWLARSLGGKGRIQKTVKQPFYRKDGVKVYCLPAYTVCVTMPDGFKTFYISRKQTRVSDTHQSRYTKRWIDSVKNVKCGA